MDLTSRERAAGSVYRGGHWDDILNPPSSLDEALGRALARNGRYLQEQPPPVVEGEALEQDQGEALEQRAEE